MEHDNDDMVEETANFLSLELENALDDLRQVLNRCQEVIDEEGDADCAPVLSVYLKPGLEELLKKVSVVWVDLGELLESIQAALRQDEHNTP